MPKDKFPHYRHDTDDLDYYCINALINCAKKLSCDGHYDDEDLKLCIDYFDSAVNIEKRNNHRNDYLILGSCANFYASNFGNVKVYISLLNGDISPNQYDLV